MDNNFTIRQLKHIIEQNNYKLQFYTRSPFYKDPDKHKFHLQLFKSRIKVAEEDLAKLIKTKKPESMLEIIRLGV